MGMRRSDATFLRRSILPLLTAAEMLGRHAGETAERLRSRLDPDDDEPARFAFQPEHDGTLDLRSAVFQALGAASMCWDGGPQGVFEDGQAREIGEALLAFIDGGKPIEPGSWPAMDDLARVLRAVDPDALADSDTVAAFERVRGSLPAGFLCDPGCELDGPHAACARLIQRPPSL